MAPPNGIIIITIRTKTRTIIRRTINAPFPIIAASTKTNIRIVARTIITQA